MTALPPLQDIALGNLPLRGGRVLEDARLTYRTWGRLAADRANAILLPSHYTGTSASPAGIIGPGRALDPARWFIVATDLFGNGNATSPSHRDTLAGRLAFPTVTIADNIGTQRTLLDALGVRELALVQGWSMGAIQAWHWATLHPDFVRAILPVCGATGCWPLNRVFLKGLKAALAADPAYRAGAPRPEGALRAFARVYAGWAYSDAFWREGGWTDLGFASEEALLDWWDEDHLAWDARDLATVLETWMDADLAAALSPSTSLADALSRVTARAIVMPSSTDRYFTVTENAIEVALTSRAELRVIDSDLGHVAGAPGRHAAESRLIEAATADLLAD